MDERAEAAAERAEDVAPHADGGGDEHEEAGQAVERARDRAERQPGSEITDRAEPERAEALQQRRALVAKDATEPTERRHRGAAHWEALPSSYLLARADIGPSDISLRACVERG